MNITLTKYFLEKYVTFTDERLPRNSLLKKKHTIKLVELIKVADIFVYSKKVSICLGAFFSLT